MLSVGDKHQKRKVQTMKKTLIGIAAGALALGASIVPVNAEGPYGLPYSESTGSMWEYLNGSSGIAEQLVLVAGLTNTLDQCGNGKPMYTLFLPTEDVLAGFLEELEVTVADLAANPAAVQALLNDHLVRGAVDPMLLTSVTTGIKKLVAISGLNINIRKLDTVIYEGIWMDWYANGNQLVGAVVTCNGWIYNMFGTFDTREYAPVIGTNPATVAPTATGDLPDTL